ncbi:MAG: hypothetical protein KGQ58_09080 [Proteobacteria bacterium]|nr:hypothetical protein [Pseudomonadota bacterium]MDE3208584.1 hypothetical protein [Pseudomonadota bacterium]
MVRQSQENKPDDLNADTGELKPCARRVRSGLSRSASLLFEVARLFEAHHMIVNRHILFDARGRRRYFIWEREDGVIAILCQHLAQPRGFRTVAYRRGKSIQDIIEQLTVFLQQAETRIEAEAEGGKA